MDLDLERPRVQFALLLCEPANSERGLQLCLVRQDNLFTGAVKTICVFHRIIDGPCFFFTQDEQKYFFSFFFLLLSLYCFTPTPPFLYAISHQGGFCITSSTITVEKYE